jgi:hypothetical protein
VIAPGNLTGVLSVQGIVTPSRRARFFALAAAGAVLLAVVVWLNATSEPPRPVVAGPAAPPSSPAARPGWKTVEYRGVQVDIPSAWQPVDVSDCEFQFTQWAPDSSPCGRKGGVAFYGSATFDPKHGPGVRRADAKDTDGAAWGGYVYAGDYAVYASDAERGVVQEVLDSAR